MTSRKLALALALAARPSPPRGWAASWRDPLVHLPTLGVPR